MKISISVSSPPRRIALLVPHLNGSFSISHHYSVLFNYKFDFNFLLWFGCLAYLDFQFNVCWFLDFGIFCCCCYFLLILCYLFCFVLIFGGLGMDCVNVWLETMVQFLDSVKRLCVSVLGCCDAELNRQPRGLEDPEILARETVCMSFLFFHLILNCSIIGRFA